MVIERFTIMNGIMYVVRGGKYKVSKVTDMHSFNITLKNAKTGHNKRWLATSYTIDEKYIIVHLPDDTTKRYQKNEWSIVYTSIHYF